jgi:large-conductance mechanosensitive channel
MNIFNSDTYFDNNDFSDFFNKYNLLPSMASVSIGFVSSEFIKSLVSDIIFPSIVLLLSFSQIKLLQLPLTNNTKFNFIKFFQSLMTLIISVLVTYYFISYFSRIIIKKEDKK